MTKLQQALKKKLLMENTDTTVVLITGLYWPFQYMLYVLLTLSSDSFLSLFENRAQGAAVSYMQLDPATDNCFSLATLSSLL